MYNLSLIATEKTDIQKGMLRIYEKVKMKDEVENKREFEEGKFRSV